MIDEIRQDQAIAYILGELSPQDALSFEGDMEREFELKELVRDLRESAAFLATILPVEPPPLSLRKRVLRTLPRQGEEEEGAHALGLSWTSPAWGALAFTLAVAFILVFIDDFHSRGRADAIESQAKALLTQLSAAKAQLADLQRESDAQKQQIAALQSQNPLASVRIASLASQTPPMAKANVVVVWDAEKQQGVIRLANMPKAQIGKDYQLWVIDPKYPTPVSAGVLSVTEDGTMVLSFKPAQPIATPDKFAISVEKAGGVSQPAGPIVFVGS